MFRIQRILGSACLAASLLLGIGGAGCSARVRVYDSYHGDWHVWDQDEDVVYHSYWSERHEPYRNYKKLDKNEQKEYWDWRHKRSDQDEKDRDKDKR
jgi:hypothetical protein